MPHKRAGVDIDRGHRFGLVDDHVATGFELDLATEGFLNFILNGIQVKNGTFARVILDLVGKLGHKLLNELHHPLVAFPTIDAHLLSLWTNQVANGADKQGKILIHHRRRLTSGNALLNGLVQTVQVGHIADQVIFRGGLCSGANNVAARDVRFCGSTLFHQ